MIYRCQGLRIIGTFSGFGVFKGSIYRCRFLPALIEARTPRDDHGHFYKEEGAPCPHGKGGGRIEPPETEESVKRKEAEVTAFKKVLKHGGSAELKTAAGRKVVIERGNEKYGAVHFEMRRYNSGDVKGKEDFDKVIDGVSKALATAEPKNNKASGRCIFEYKGYRAACEEREGTLVFISGYKINKKNTEDE